MTKDMQEESLKELLKDFFDTEMLKNATREVGSKKLINFLTRYSDPINGEGGVINETKQLENK